MAKRSHKGNAGQLPRTTFRELLELVEKPTDRKRPSAKALRTSGTEVLVQAVYGDASITVYKNGWAIYTEGRRATVCNVWHCQKAVEYVFQDGSAQCIQFEEFADRSCVIRLALEGEYRLTRNESTRKRLRESADGNETIWKREPDKAPDILTEIIVREESKALFKRIAGSLTVRQAQVFRLHILEGYSQGEVAEMLGCTAANISMCVRRIREKLMDVMDARDMGNREKLPEDDPKKN